MDKNEIDKMLEDIEGDFDPTFLVNAAAEAAKGGLAEKAKTDAANKADADAGAKASNIISLDAAATEACAQVEVAQKAPKPDAATIAAKQAVAAQATSAQDMAAANLPQAAVDKRIAAANDALKKANANWSANPSDPVAAARARCWQATLIKAQGGGTVSPDKLPTTPPKPSFFMKMLGPLPVIGWMGVGGGVAALATGIVMLLRRRKGR